MEKKSNRKFVIIVALIFFAIVLIGALLSKNSALKQDVLNRGVEIKSLTEEKGGLYSAQKRLEQILSSGRARIQEIEKTFVAIKEAGDIWMYFSDDPEKAARALTAAAAESKDSNIEEVGRLLMRKVRREFVGEEWSFKGLCPADVCPGNDSELAKAYQNLDGKYMTSLGDKMEMALRLLFANPQMVHGLILLKGDPVLAHMSDADKKQVRHFIKIVEDKYFKVAQTIAFQVDIEAYQLIVSNRLKGNVKADSEGELMLANDYNERLQEKITQLHSRWSMFIEEQELIYEVFSKNSEEWNRVFNLLERKLKV